MDGEEFSSAQLKALRDLIQSIFLLTNFVSQSPAAPPPPPTDKGPMDPSSSSPNGHDIENVQVHKPTCSHYQSNGQKGHNGKFAYDENEKCVKSNLIQQCVHKQRIQAFSGHGCSYSRNCCHRHTCPHRRYRREECLVNPKRAQEKEFSRETEQLANTNAPEDRKMLYCSCGNTSICVPESTFGLLVKKVIDLNSQECNPNGETINVDANQIKTDHNEMATQTLEECIPNMPEIILSSEDLPHAKQKESLLKRIVHKTEDLTQELTGSLKKIETPREDITTPPRPPFIPNETNQDHNLVQNTEPDQDRNLVQNLEAQSIVSNNIEQIKNDTNEVNDPQFNETAEPQKIELNNSSEQIIEDRPTDETPETIPNEPEPESQSMRSEQQDNEVVPSSEIVESPPVTPNMTASSLKATEFQAPSDVQIPTPLPRTVEPSSQTQSIRSEDPLEKREPVRDKGMPLNSVSRCFCKNTDRKKSQLIVVEIEESDSEDDIYDSPAVKPINNNQNCSDYQDFRTTTSRPRFIPHVSIPARKPTTKYCTCWKKPE